MKNAELIRTIEREEAEERGIVAALEARNARMETMTAEEKDMVARLHADASADWDFLGL